MRRFFSDAVVFGGILTPSVSPPFSKSENGGENPASSPPNSVVWNLGEAGGGHSLIQNIINFRIYGNLFFLRAEHDWFIII
jgi:hypothetical protein